MKRIVVAGMSCLLLAAGPAAAAAASTPAQKCAAAKHKAAFKKAAAEGQCYQKAFLAGVAVDPACLAKADVKFTTAIAKAETKGGCANVGDVADIRAAVETCVGSISALTPTDLPTCALDASCTAGHACVSLTDNTSASTFGLRVAQLTFSSPSSLTGGLLGTTVASAVKINNANSCNVIGNGSFSWLLQLDTMANTLTTGGALPVSNPTLGYSFLNGMAFGSAVAPLTVSLALAVDGTFSTGSGNIVMPVYLDTAGSAGFVLPLRGARFNGQLSTDHNCIGNYNAAGLVAPDCLADASHPTFVDGATLHASINLEDADAVIVSALGQSLCVLLSGDAGTYGDGGFPVRCKRSSGTIVLAGDWCSATDMPGGCADALAVSATYAASSVVIH